jgi:hypothetical protein
MAVCAYLQARPVSLDTVQQILPKPYCCYSSLDTWVILCMTATRFEPLMCWASPLHMFWTFTLSWFCMTSACFLPVSAIKSYPYVILKAKWKARVGVRLTQQTVTRFKPFMFYARRWLGDHSYGDSALQLSCAPVAKRQQKEQPITMDYQWSFLASALRQSQKPSVLIRRRCGRWSEILLHLQKISVALSSPYYTRNH